MRRRELALSAGVACAAAVTGWGLWHWRRTDEAAPAELWTLAFERPEGGQLELASLRGRPLVLNFWATWCAPCIREMPALDRFQKQFGAIGWQVVGIAADNAGPVRDFLSRLPVSFPVGLAGFAGIDLSRRLGNLANGLPFTVIVDRQGSIARRHSGETRFEDLAAWAEGIS